MEFFNNKFTETNFSKVEHWSFLKNQFKSTKIKHKNYKHGTILTFKNYFWEDTEMANNVP